MDEELTHCIWRLERKLQERPKDLEGLSKIVDKLQKLLEDGGE